MVSLISDNCANTYGNHYIKHAYITANDVQLSIASCLRRQVNIFNVLYKAIK
jgi:hypothetical protein